MRTNEDYDKKHVHLHAASQWFSRIPDRLWANCPQTQASLLRLSMQPAVVGRSVGVSDSRRVLTVSLGSPGHRFWGQDYACHEIADEIARRVIGHNQVADALLLDLAIRKGGTLATFNTRLHSVLPPNSPLQAAIELIPTASSSQ